MKSLLVIASASLLTTLAQAQVIPNPIPAKDCGCNATIASTQKPMEKNVASVSEKTDQSLAATLSPKSSWQELLSSLGKIEKTQFLFVIGSRPGRVPAMAPYIDPQGEAAMRALASSTHRVWRQVNGVQTFAQTPYYNTVSYQNSLVVLSDWINQLNEQELQNITTKGLVLSEIPLPARNAILRVLRDPDMHFVLLEKQDKTVVRLMLDPIIKWRNAAEKKENRYSLRDFRNFQYMVQVPPAKTKTAEDKDKINALQPLQPGALDFGTGQVSTLREILEKATQAFGKKMTLENPLETVFFISGAYSETSFAQALKTVLSNDPLELKWERESKNIDSAKAIGSKLLETTWKDFAASQIDTTWMRSFVVGKNNMKESDIQKLNKEYGAAESVPAQIFYNAQDISVADLTHGRPGLLAAMENNGLQPDSKVSPGITLVMEVATEGKHEFSVAVATIGGKRVPVIVPNRAEIDLLEDF